MCRIAFFPEHTNPGSKRIKPFLEYLIDYQGGDGAGVASWVDGKPLVVKGVKHDQASLAAVMEKKGAPGWLFHARAASIGPKVDELCQPFVSGEHLFVHNGHWMDWRAAYWPLILNGQMTVKQYVNDSRVISEIVRKTGPVGVWLVPSGVFVTWERGKEFAVGHVVSGAFAYSSLPEEEGGGYVYASSFPSEWPMTIFEFANDTKVELRPEGPNILVGAEPKEVAGTGKGYRNGGMCRRSGFDGMAN